MKIGVNLKINVTDIDKAKLYNGEKGTYLNAVAFIDIENKSRFGDNGMITQAISKEEKEAGNRGAILGNSTVFWRDDGQSSQPSQAAPAQGGGFDSFDDDSAIPF